MTDIDDTMAAPEPPDPDTTICDTALVDHGELAWSADDDDQNGGTILNHHPWRHAWAVVGVIAACGAVLVIGVFAWHEISHGHHDDVQVSQPTVTVAVVEPASRAHERTTPPVRCPAAAGHYKTTTQMAM